MMINTTISREKLNAKSFKSDNTIKELYPGKIRRFNSDVMLIKSILLKKKRLLQ